MQIQTFNGNEKINIDIIIFVYSHHLLSISYKYIFTYWFRNSSLLKDVTEHNQNNKNLSQTV
jgi:hypothetical protein